MFSMCRAMRRCRCRVAYYKRTDRVDRASVSLDSDAFDGCCIVGSRAVESRMRMEIVVPCHLEMVPDWVAVDRLALADRLAVAAGIHDGCCCRRQPYYRQQCHRHRRPTSGLAEILVDDSTVDLGCQCLYLDCRIFDYGRLRGCCERSVDWNRDYCSCCWCLDCCWRCLHSDCSGYQRSDDQHQHSNLWDEHIKCTVDEKYMRNRNGAS